MLFSFIDMYNEAFQSCRTEILVRYVIIYFKLITDTGLFKQRTLLMKKQQKRRASAQMIMANHDARPKNWRQKSAAEDTALLISQSQSNTSLNGKKT